MSPDNDNDTDRENIEEYLDSGRKSLLMELGAVMSDDAVWRISLPTSRGGRSVATSAVNTASSPVLPSRQDRASGHLYELLRLLIALVLRLDVPDPSSSKHHARKELHEFSMLDGELRASDLRRIAEIAELFEVPKMALPFWQRAAAAGDRDAIAYLPLVSTEAGDEELEGEVADVRGSGLSPKRTEIGQHVGSGDRLCDTTSGGRSSGS